MKYVESVTDVREKKRKKKEMLLNRVSFVSKRNQTSFNYTNGLAPQANSFKKKHTKKVLKKITKLKCHGKHKIILKCIFW